MFQSSLLSTFAAAFAIFFVSDLVYTLDHYLVHHDRERYSKTHARHHLRYGGAKKASHLDSYEVSTYGTAAIMSAAGTSVLTLMTGNPGFFLGAVLKFLHSLLFHLYQHRWWGPVNVRKLNLGKPARGWGIASDRYHAFHHSNPEDALFAYTESWKGFDRLLEWAHPWLVKYTVDGKSRIGQRTEKTSQTKSLEQAESEAS